MGPKVVRTHREIWRCSFNQNTYIACRETEIVDRGENRRRRSAYSDKFVCDRLRLSTGILQAFVASGGAYRTAIAGSTYSRMLPQENNSRQKRHQKKQKNTLSIRPALRNPLCRFLAAAHPRYSLLVAAACARRFVAAGITGGMRVARRSIGKSGGSSQSLHHRFQSQ